MKVKQGPEILAGPLPTSFIRQKIVSYEEVGIVFDGSEGTIGIQIDRMIGSAMEKGTQLGEITVMISEEDWHRLR